MLSKLVEKLEGVSDDNLRHPVIALMKIIVALRNIGDSDSSIDFKASLETIKKMDKAAMRSQLWDNGKSPHLPLTVWLAY
jgi:hypothetical protein